MCLNEKIIRCQSQIAAIYDLPKSEQCNISLQGFQLQLQNLLNEKSKGLQVVSAEVLEPHTSGHRKRSMYSANKLRELAQEACYSTIEKATQNAATC